jgi:hypothetical protein
MKPKSEFRSPAAKQVLVVVLVILGFLLVAIIDRIGSYGTETLRTWSSAPGDLGIERTLTLTLEKTVSAEGFFGSCRTYRIRLSDGYYGLSHEFDIPGGKPESFVQDSSVTWSTNDVRFQMPNGVLLVFPAEAVLRQVGR